ncbi:alpha-2-macroglobulin family protein [Microcoleus sp. AT3-D2]|uniref:alpha-2-macroglobulin family protein n=1 Tax=Microcoleus sp. AT3-D2 TaxID=2818612 RepID=UPI002FCE830D
MRDLLLLDLPDRTNGNLLPRTDFADVAYCGIVRTDELGKAEVSFKLPDAITSYNIEAFAMSQSGTEWCSVKKRLEVSLPVWAEFKLPKFIYPGDKSLATLYVKCASGKFGLRLFCNGVPVEFSLFDAEQIAPNIYQSKQAKVIFEAQPGEWRAEVQDLVTQDYDVCVRTVGELGKFEEVAQRFQLLRAGETFDLRSHQVWELRVLSCLEKPFNLLCDATTNYEHHCCEQTAAKLLAAVASLTAGGDAAKLRNVIIAGVAREQKMYLPGKGLALYPPQEWEGSNAQANDYWGRIAAQHLCDLATIGESLFGLAAVKSDLELESALRSAIAIGEGAAAAYHLPTIPTQIASGRDAYRSFMRLASTRNEALLYARSYLKTPETTHQNNVINRSEQAYCATVLLMAGENSDLRSALNTVNQLARCLNGDGRLYSTVDSVGMIALMTALQAAGINLNGTVYALQEGEMRALESEQVFSTEKMEEIALKEGTALVDMKGIAIEDWSTFAADIPVKIQLSKTNSFLQPGDTVELIAEVESYQPGLLLQVCLPPVLSRLEGGGEVKRFSVDFCGQKTIKIPLRVTGYTSPAGEHWRAVVRNMFNDEETGNSGLLRVQVGG